MSDIRVTVTPDARKERFEETAPGVFAIAVREPAEGNRANRRVRELLAIHFGVRPRDVKIEAGHRSERKRVHIILTEEGV